MSPTCSRGPNDSPGCDQDLKWIDGKWWSPHYEPSHWSRVKRGTVKPKTDQLGLLAGATDAEIMEALKVRAQELEQSGKVG